MNANLRRRTFLALALAALACADAHAATRPQENEKTGEGRPATLRAVSEDVLRGRRLLEEGDAEGAEKVLRAAAAQERPDPAALHYLGLALARRGKSDEARAALKRAVDIRAHAFDFEFNMQRREKADPGMAESEARRARFRARTGELMESVEAYAALAGRDEAFWRSWLAALRLYARLADDPRFAAAPFNLSKLTTRAVVTERPEPRYTEEARQTRTGGRIFVRAILNADGSVGGVVVTRGLGRGLDESAVAATRGIKFTPATIEGRPVAQVVVVEYGFRIH